MPGEGASPVGPAAAEGGAPAGVEEGTGPGVASVGERTGGFPLQSDPTDSIPWRHRLSTRLLTLTAILTLVGVVVFAVTEARFQDSLMEQVEAGAELFSHTIERATHRAMLEDRREDAYEIMRVIGAEPGTDKVRIFNKEGRITFSTDPRDVNTLVDKRAEACFGCHQADQPISRLPSGSRARVFEAGGHRSMAFLKPIYNEARCSTAECHHHPRSAQVLGVLDVAVSLREVDRRIAEFRGWSIVLTALGVVLLAGFFLWLARRHVVLPVAALVEATRRVAHDELALELHVRSNGELGLLAASFNDMTRALRRTQAELRDLQAGLEQQVEQRTADLQAAQAALVQSEKLSSLGRLSASIAHEINNPLAGILTFAKLMLREVDAAVPDEAKRKTLARNLALVQRETERCSAIVRNLLDFARERPMELREVDLDAAVAESLQLVAHQLAIQGHTLEKRLEPVPPVRADFGQLRQALVNVILNGCEAMQKGGRLSIVTGSSADGQWVEAAVTDTGPGIAPEHLPHIFDPFFTTKEKGTGLGLSVVYGIIQRHGGTVLVRSQVGKGSTFTVRLPAVRPPA